MIEIGTLKDVRRYADKHMVISEIMEKERHNHLVLLVGGVLDTTTQNTIVQMGIVPFEKWRVIGAGLVCHEATGDTIDPVIHFGTRADPDGIAIATVATEGSVEIKVEDYSSYDEYGVLPVDVLSDAPELTVAWSEASGSIWNVWQTTIKGIQAKSTVDDGGTGEFIPFVVIEVAGEGKF